MHYEKKKKEERKKLNKNTLQGKGKQIYFHIPSLKVRSTNFVLKGIYNPHACLDRHRHTHTHSSSFSQQVRDANYQKEQCTAQHVLHSSLERSTSNFHTS